MRKQPDQGECEKPDQGELENGVTMEVYIVRHGKTIWNAEGKLQGHADIELNE